MIGMYKDGGDFDASKPGAGFDAHRFLAKEHEGYKEDYAKKGQKEESQGSERTAGNGKQELRHHHHHWFHHKIKDN